MVMGWDRVRNGPRRIGRARRVSRSVARSSEPTGEHDRVAGRVAGELACVAAELTGRSVLAVRFLGF